MSSPPSPPPPPPPRHRPPKHHHQQHQHDHQQHAQSHMRSEYCHPLQSLAALFVPDPFSGRDNFPPFEDVFENSIVASEVSFSSSLNMSIGARAALDEHARMIARFGIDGAREHENECQAAAADNRAGATTRAAADADHPLDRLWNKVLEDKTALPKGRNNRCTLADRLVVENEERHLDASYLNEFARVATTTLDPTLERDEDDDDGYFDSSRILLLASPEKACVPQLQGRSPTSRREYSSNLEDSFLSNASSPISPQEHSDHNSSLQCLFQPPTSPPRRRNLHLSPPPSHAKQVIDSSFVSLAAIDLSRISLHDEVNAALAMARRSPDSSFFSMEPDNRETIDDNGGEMYFRTGGTILFPESSSSSDSPHRRRTQELGQDRDVVSTPPSRGKQQSHLNLSSLGLSPIASARIARATNRSSPNDSFVSTSSQPASPAKASYRQDLNSLDRSAHCTPGTTATTTSSAAMRSVQHGESARTPPPPRRQRQYDRNLPRGNKTLPRHDTPPLLRNRINDFQMSELVDVSPIAGRAAAAAAAATCMVHSNSHSSLLSLGSSSPVHPLQQQHGRPPVVLTQWPQTRGEVETHNAVKSPSVVTVEDDGNNDPTIAGCKENYTARTLPPVEIKNSVLAQNLQPQHPRPTAHRRPPPFSMNDRRRYRTVVPTRVFYDADDFESHDSFSSSRRDYL